jgi:hypothetical protein
MTLQNCWVIGGGCGQKEWSTRRTLLWPWRTSWMQSTRLVCVPPPHDREHSPKSETFHRGGHGWSLHVRTFTSGRSDPRQCAADTAVSTPDDTHTTFDS